MHFQFLLSDYRGDIVLSPEDLEQPFLISPDEQHPFLTLADYFGILQKFVLLDDGSLLLSALSKQTRQTDISLSDISEVILRSEKHGAFYHIASVEIAGLKESIKFTLTSALSESARKSLDKEYAILKQLSEIDPGLIPQIYCKGSVLWKTEHGSEEFLMVLGEWFDNYHEWHTGDDPESKSQKIQLWDYKNGYRFLSCKESYELLRQAAHILTCYYDQASFRQIYPWHHGAGDFVFTAEPADKISVKLITARQYEPLVHFEQPEETDRLVAAIQFLLNLTLRIRLDRIDGVGGPVWIGAFAVQAAVAGFCAGLAATKAEGRLMIGPVEEFMEIMQSFDAREIYDMYASLLEIYAEEDQDDFSLIRENIADHAAELHEALQNLSL